jgi:hypothetical protein
MEVFELGVCSGCSAVRVFDEIMPISFAEFDAAVDHQYARTSRYAAQSIESELENILREQARR